MSLNLKLNWVSFSLACPTPKLCQTIHVYMYVQQTKTSITKVLLPVQLPHPWLVRFTSKSNRALNTKCESGEQVSQLSKLDPLIRPDDSKPTKSKKLTKKCRRRKKLREKNL